MSSAQSFLLNHLQQTGAGNFDLVGSGEGSDPQYMLLYEPCLIVLDSGINNDLVRNVLLALFKVLLECRFVNTAYDYDIITKNDYAEHGMVIM